MSDLSLNQIKWCAEECARQQSGELSVRNMCVAFYTMAQFYHGGVTTVSGNLVLTLGRMVEPDKNHEGFRKIPVIVGGRLIDTKLEVISRQLENLILYGQSEPKDFYQEFEEIHPFVDGNGRVGALLYTFLLGQIDDPQRPPEFQRRGE